MYNTKTQQLGILLRTIDSIIEKLGIEQFSLKEQEMLIERFSSILFKRILLRVPDESVEKIKEALNEITNKEGGEKFMEVVAKTIPNFDTCLEEDIEKTVADFRR